MPNLTDLAPEVILLIADELPRSALAGLLRTSRRFRPLLEPELYRAVHWYFRQRREHWKTALRIGEEGEEENRDDTDRLFMLFVRTILGRPSLAAYVRELDLQLELEYKPVAYKLDIPLSDEMALSAAIGKLSLPNRLHMMEGLGLRTLDCAVAVLLSQLPHLSVLFIEHSLVRNFDLVGDMLHYLGSGPLSLPGLAKPSLTSVWFGNSNLAEMDNVRLTGNIIPVYALFHMPSLESIILTLSGRSNNEDLRKSLSTSSITLENLTFLCLLNSEADVDTLGHVLAVTPKLETLEYNFVQDLDHLWYDDNHECGYCDEWKQLSTVLRKISATLECLTISISFHYLEDYKEPEVEPDWVGEVWQRRGKLGSLKQFPKLRSLEIPTAVLLGYERNEAPGQLIELLPPNLEELILRDDLINMWFEYGYQWTPWESHATGARLATSFQETCDATPILAQLENYLSNLPKRSDAFAGLQGVPYLDTLIMKQSHNRFWPAPFRSQLHRLVHAAGIDGKIQIRRNEYSEDVLEFTLASTPDKEVPRVLHDQRRKSLSRVYL